MPVSHIGLTVSHLPTSCSFFLAALQPLGYRFLGQWGNQIGLGVHEPDFFLTQETPGIKAGAAHVAFAASSRTMVREFYANGLQAGGRPHGSPSTRTDEDESFNAAVLDLDGNSVEVVFHESAAVRDTASSAGRSRVLTLEQGVAPTLGDNRSAVSLATIKSVTSSLAKQSLAPAKSSLPGGSTKAHSIAPSSASKSRSEAPIIQRSFTTPHLTPQSSNDNIQISRKTLVGTILGAAAGAAVAYAMCRSEEDSARQEHVASITAKTAPQHVPTSNHHLLDMNPAHSSPSRSARNASEIEYYAGYDPVRAIEAPPPASQAMYYHPSYTTVITGSQHPETVSARSRVSVPRSQTAPESRGRNSVAASFIPEDDLPELPQSIIGSSYSQRSSPEPDYRSAHSNAKSHHSKAKSSTSTAKHSSTSSSKRSSRSKSRHRSRSRTPQSALHRILESSPEPPKSTTNRSSVLGRSVAEDNYTPSALGRSTASDHQINHSPSVLGRSVPKDDKYSPYPSSSDNEPTSDMDTVVPSDSVSQIGSSSRRSVRRTSEASSTHSLRRDDSRRASEGMVSAGEKKKHRKKKSSRTSDASTVTPEKYQAGSVASLPVRAITGSMLEGTGYQGRSVVSYYG